MGFLDQWAGFGVTFRTQFWKTFTQEYPQGPKVTAPRFHGRHQLNRWPDGLEKCVGCELCAWACSAATAAGQMPEQLRPAWWKWCKYRYGACYERTL